MSLTAVCEDKIVRLWGCLDSKDGRGNNADRSDAFFSVEPTLSAGLCFIVLSPFVYCIAFKRSRISAATELAI